jgi:predicted secreted protein with PEFG-CTERM motif
MAKTTLDGTEYTVTGRSATVKLTSLTIEPNLAVKLELDGQGEVQLTLPKSMIDGISSVEGNNNQIEFTKVDSADSTTVTFTVPSGVSEVEISGAVVVPEFGVIAALILAASLVAVIGFARFKGTSLGFGRF